MIVSRFGDAQWNLAPWTEQTMIVNFGDGPQRKGASRIDRLNADILRLVAGWWLWGPRSATSPSTLWAQINALRPLFILCSKEGIVASDLSKFPAVADKLPEVIRPTKAGTVLTLLHTLFEQRDQFGVTLLDFEGLKRLNAALPEHKKLQTPYIPPRIWTYQLNRLRDFLDDFHSHREQIEACYHFCLDAYITNYGSLAEACRKGHDTNRLPFSSPKKRKGILNGTKFLGPFPKIAQQFEIDGLLQRWCLLPGQSFDDKRIPIFSKYLQLVNKVGIAYMLNFSMMRVQEGMALRANCLIVENDETFGDIYMLRGVTTKTIEDDDARWVIPPSVKIAVEALACIARLRMIVAEANPEVPTTHIEIQNPYLMSRAYEPWATGVNEEAGPSIRQSYFSYQSILQEYPRLFDIEQLRITDADLQISRQITPNLDRKNFEVGKIWPLAWHQLRRTGAVNMQASGLVSDFSVQYQLKHATRAMSLFYGQGYSQLRFNDSVRAEYIQTMYEVLSKEIARLFTDRFVSPYGIERKVHILKIVNTKDIKKLVAAAKAGQVAWRETLLGGCTKRGPCEYGGVDNIARCGGGDGQAPCAEAIYDRERAPKLIKLGEVIASRLIEAPTDSPYREALEAQQRAVKNVLHVIDN